MPKSLKDIVNSKQIGIKTAFKNIGCVFYRDIKRIVTNPLLILVLVGALILPCLYAWLTIAANWDPYSVTKNIKIAIVNEDKGVNSDLTGDICVGNLLTEKLSENDQIGWTFTDRQDAIWNVEHGNYYAAIILSCDFSQNLVKIFTEPNCRDFIKLEYYVNERENGAAVKITDTGASTIEQQINEQFVGKVTAVVADTSSKITGSTAQDIANGAGLLSLRVTTLAGNVSGLNGIIGQGQITIDKSKETISKANLALTSIKNQSDDLYNKVESCKSNIDNARNNINSFIQELENAGLDYNLIIRVLSQFESSLSDASSSLSKASSVLYKVSFTVEEIIYNLDSASSMLDALGYAGKGFSEKMSNIYTMLMGLSGAIDNQLAEAPQLIKDLFNADSASIGSFMSSPVVLETQVLNKIENNGTAISPFFTNLAIWVLGIVLIALFRTEVEPPKRKGWSASQAYIARGMLFSVAAAISSVFCSIGNLFVLGIQCENPVLYLLTCMLIAVVYANIIYMLAACFKHVGRAVACILVIMQIPGSSGMFPIQLMPEVFQNIFPFLPFTYGINALRECIISIDYLYWLLDILALFVFLVLSLIVGLYARESLRGINNLFDKELAANTLMICDASDHVKQEPDTMTTVVKNLSTNKEAAKLSVALDALCAKYKKLSKIGLICLAVVPQAYLIVMSVISMFVAIDINTKLVWMSIWMLGVIAFSAFVIVVEYKYHKITKERKDTIWKAVTLKKDKSNA